MDAKCERSAAVILSSTVSLGSVYPNFLQINSYMMSSCRDYLVIFSCVVYDRSYSNMLGGFVSVRSVITLSKTVCFKWLEFFVKLPKWFWFSHPTSYWLWCVKCVSRWNTRSCSVRRNNELRFPNFSLLNPSVELPYTDQFCLLFVVCTPTTIIVIIPLCVLPMMNQIS